MVLVVPGAHDSPPLGETTVIVPDKFPVELEVAVLLDSVLLTIAKQLSLESVNATSLREVSLIE